MSLDPEVLGKRIRQARERVGLSQEDFAHKIGRDQRAISEYENGKRRIVVTDLPVLAQILQVPVIYFFEGEESLDDLDSLVLAEFNRLTNIDDKTTLIELIRLFCDTVNRHTSS